MEEKRITFFGFTDYSGNSLEFIIDDFKNNYLYKTRKAIQRLHELDKEVHENYGRLEEPDEVRNHIVCMIARFEGFEYDFTRLLTEIPHGVENRHINIINQINVGICQ